MNFILKKGDSFSGCKIISKCGQGAFGTVYLALNPIEQPVIIKIVPASANADRELKGLKNYMAVSGKHPNLLQIFHIGEFEGGFYYIMEAADNCGTDDEYYPATLGNFFRQDQDFSPEKAIQITRNLLEGLKFMHHANLIHRDIKPDNIIFVNNVPKLSDPGLVIEKGQTSSCAGTIGFIPPEVLNEDADMDQNADIYALGKVFYCMVTGLRPKQYPQLPLNMRIEVCRQIYPAISRMCNRNPQRRFKNAEDFLSGLPIKLEKPTRFEKMRENFRNWCILNRERARFLLISCIVFTILLTSSIAAYIAISVYNAHKEAESKKSIEKYLAINHNRKELLDLQIQQYCPHKYDIFKNLNRKLSAAFPADIARSTELVSQHRMLLQKCALEQMPDLSSWRVNDPQHNFATIGKARGFLSSPLASYLNAKDIKSYIKKLENFERMTYRGYNGPRCHSEYLNFNMPELAMIFVPPGAVRLPHNKKIYQIPYHFWICKNEIISDDFFHRLGIRPQKNPRPGAPVERVTWNDLLFYCHSLTKRFKELNALPPGYIIRPLNEAEWQFAADNAWLGKDTASPKNRIVAKETSNGTTHPSGLKNPNKLGILDIYGNVTEIVSPMEPTKMQLSNVIRGGSFLTSLKKCQTYRNEYLAYQNIPFDIGSRVALAPGDMSYFDKNFFLGGETQCELNGKIYELIGSNLAIVPWHNAEHLAYILGGKLAELKTPQERSAVIKAMPLTGQWPTIVGGIKVNNKWMWKSDKSPITYGRFGKDPAKSANGHLTYQSGMWVKKQQERMSLFICEWDASKYHDRNKDMLKRTGKHLLAHFSYKNREFILLSFPLSSHAALRCAELLGGRLACLDSPELLELAKNKLAKFADRRIRIGAYAKRSDWYWLNGKKVNTNVIYDSKISRYKTESKNNNFAMLYQNKLYDSFLASAFLLELDKTPPVSPAVR